MWSYLKGVWPVLNGGAIGVDVRSYEGMSYAAVQVDECCESGDAAPPGFKADVPQSSKRGV